MSEQEIITELQAELTQAVGVITALRAENEALRQRIAELEKKKRPPPSFVKPNRPRKADMAGRVRLLRAAVHNHGRRRSTPTRVERHAYDVCPDCGYALAGDAIKRTREVIEIPPVTAEVVEHQFIKRRCPVCQAWKTPPATVIDGQMLGQGRIGVRLASLIGTLRTTYRLPLAQIQALLDQVWDVQLSHGGLQECLATLAQALASVRTQIVDQTRASPVQHMDETGMRENGQNGYVWTQATAGAQPTRVFTYTRSRAGEVARTLLGAYDGVLTTDFYAAYDTCGLTRQRCWAHLARDLHALREEYPEREDVQEWCTAVLAVKTKALALDTATLTVSERAQYATLLERQTHALARCYWKHTAHPAHTLAKRLYRYEGELFTFIRVPGVVATNNLAERAIRPFVIARKISGGTRSTTGSTIRCDLATVFHTWAARGLNPFAACLAALHTPLPLV
jgi:transposase